MNSDRMTLRQMELGPMANFVYLVGCNTTRECAVVDPAWDVTAIVDAAKQSGMAIRHVLLTHGHPDHMNGLEELLAATDATVWLHHEEMDYMRIAAAMFGVRVDFVDRHASNFKTLSDGDSVTVGALPVRIVHTPGHTPGSLCFLVERCLISGDTLFVGACGRVDLPGSDPEKMWYSLNQKLKALEDSTVLFPGHHYSDEPTSTIGAEKRSNPYMKFPTLERFLQVMRAY